MNIEEHNHLAEQIACNLDSKCFRILQGLGFKDVGDLMDYLKRRTD